MAKEKDYSTKLGNLLISQDFKVFVGDLGEEVVAMAAGSDSLFDKFGAGRVIIANDKFDIDDRRTAVATIYKQFMQDYSKEGGEFYIDIKKDQLDATAVLDILINDEMFQKRFKKLSKKNDYNDTVVALSKEFMVKPSLVAKYTKSNK